MPRRKSPLSEKKRSSPVHRHPSPTPSSGGRAASIIIHHHPHHTTTTTRPPIESPSPVLGHSSAVPSQPSYSETILQRPTLATDSSSFVFPPVAAVLPPAPSTQPHSRRHSSSSMRTASMTFETVAPSATPTGRISKAKKGKRVHACEFPGCGKVFTRAEHRRRHELNHNPEAMYRCPQPGCGKAFHRIDLLQRHQERHDLEASATQPRQTSHPPPPMSSPPTILSASAMASPSTTEAPRTSSGGLSIGSLVHPQHPQSHGYANDPALSGFGLQGMSFLTPYSTTDEPFFYGSESSQSPFSDNYGRSHRQSMSSASSVAAYDHNSVSPMMSSSIPGGWMPATAPPSVLPASMFEEGAGGYVSSSTVSSMPIPLSDLDGYEWTAIQRELSTVPGLVFDTSGHGISDTIRWHCLELYWQYFHPSFPIVHRPTFLPAKPSPLLASAMLAIGSFYDTRPDAKAYSLALQEIATRLLRRRPSITSRSRIADLQTVLLLEILSKYCARHVSVQTSSRFRALFASLHQSKQWLSTSPLAVHRTLKQEKTAEDLAKAHKFWVEHETRRRIFHACSVLDTQQVSLFEQPPTIMNHDSLRGAKGVASSRSSMDGIHLPCNEDLWDASSIDDWSNFAATCEYLDVATVRSTYQSASVNDYSFFQHQIINGNGSSLQRCSEEIRSPPEMGGTLSKTRFNYHVLQMAKHTPIKHLLTVAGESWFLGRRVEHEGDYLHSKNTLRDWVGEIAAVAHSGGPPSTLVAHWHALKVLRMVVDASEKGDLFRTTHMLHEDWAVYLATLVCWVHGYRRGWTQAAISVTLGKPDAGLPPQGSDIPAPLHQGMPISSAIHPPLMDPNEAKQETYAYLKLTNVRTPQALGRLVPAVVGRTKGLLESVRTKKFGQHVIGGLINDAERVLYRLVEGPTNSMF